MTLLVGLPESSGGRITFPQSTSSFHHDSPFPYIIWEMNSRPVCGRSSETFHTIDMIIIVVVFIIVIIINPSNMRQ
jgi:hypothetical protein